MKRTLHVAASGALVVLLSVTLSSCSLFHRSGQGTAAPASVAAGSSTATSSSVPTVQPSTAAPTPTAPVNAPSPPQVPGYTLTAASATVQRKFQPVANQFRGVYSGLTVRTVMKGTQQIGVVVLLGLHPELVGNTQVEQRLVPGMVKGMSGQGATVKTQKVNGVDVAVATTKTTSIVAWYRTGTVVLMLANGADATPSVTFSKAYIAAK